MSDPENWTVDHREYKDLPKELLKLETPNLDTFLYRHRARYGQQVNAFVADGRPDGKGTTSISSTPHNYRLDGMLMLGTAIDAFVTGTRQAVVDIPGVSMDWDDPLHTHGAFQTIRQGFSALAGNAEPLADIQVEALIVALKLQKGEEIRIRGESQGVDQAAGIITSMTTGRFAEQQFQITNVDLVEPILSYGRHSFLELFRTGADLNNFEASLIQQYLDENNEIGIDGAVPFEKESTWHKMADRRLKKLQSFAVYSSAAAIRMGIDAPLVRAVQDGSTGLRHAQFTLSRAVDSSVSHARDIALLAEALEREGASVRRSTLVTRENDLTAEGKPKLLAHGFSRSLGKSFALAQSIQKKAA